MPSPFLLSDSYSPSVLGRFTQPLNDFDTLSSTSTMPPGGSISRAGNAMLYAVDGGVAKLTYAPNNILLYNNDFQTTAEAGSTRPWTNGQGSVTPNAIIAPDGTTTASIFTGTGTDGVVRQSIASSAIATYIVSAWLKVPTGTKVTYIGMTDGAINNVGNTTITVTNTWQRFSFKFTRTASGVGMYVGGYSTIASGDILHIWGAQIEAVTYQTSPSGTYYLNYPTPNTTSAYYGPRFDYDPRPSLAGTASIAGSAVTLPAIFNDGTPASSIDNAYVGQTITVGGTDYPVTAYVGSTRIATVTGTPTSGSQSFTLTNPGYLLNRGLLVEGTRTNMFSLSQQFDLSPWVSSNINTTGSWTDVATAPDGTQTADKIRPANGATTDTYTVYRGTGISSGSATFSIYAKAAGWNFFRITFGGSFATTAAIVNLTTGAITNLSGNVTATNVGNGWWRISMSSVYLSGADPNVYFWPTNSASYPYTTGNGTDGALVWGAQLEATSFPSSYMGNSGTGTLTRAAETFSLTGYANRLVEAYYIDEETGANYSGNSALSTGTVTISPPTFGWVTSLRAYTNAYAGSISSPSWLSFSRAGNAMYYDSTGTLTWAPANLIQQSQTFNNAYWTKSSVTVSADAIAAPDGTTTADNIISTVGTGEQRVFANPIPSTVGIRYTYSVYAKTGGANWLVMRDDARGFADTSFDLVNGVVGTVGSGRTASILSVGSGWYRCSVTVEVSASWVVGSVSFCLADVDNGRATFVGNGVKSIYLWGAQLEPVTYQTAPSAYIPTTSAAVYGPRYDFDPSTVPATPLGLLIEEQRSNLLTYSQPTVTGWSTAAVTGAITFNSSDTLAPTGQASKAAKLAATATSYLNQALTFSATTYSYSFYAKSGADGTVLRPQVYDGVTDHSCLVNLNTLVVSSVTNLVGTPKVNSVGNGWYRIEIVFTVAGATTGEARLGVLGAGTAYFYGAQLEVGAFSTSYMGDTITGSPPATRAADVAQLTGSALTTLQGSSVTAISEAVSSVSTNRYLINARKIASGNYGDYISLGSLASQIYAGSVVQANLTYSPAPTTTSIFRAAFAIQANNFAAVADNGTVQTDGTGSIVTGIDQGWLGGYSDGIYLNGYVRSMALYNQRLPDAILAQKSTVGAPY